MVNERGNTGETFGTEKLFVIQTAIGLAKNNVAFMRHKTYLTIYGHDGNSAHKQTNVC